MAEGQNKRVVILDLTGDGDGSGSGFKGKTRCSASDIRDHDAQDRGPGSR